MHHALDELIGETLVHGIKRQNGRPHVRRLVNALLVQEPFKKMDRNIQMLIRKGEHRQHFFKQLSRLIFLTQRVKLVNGNVNTVHAGGHKGMHTAVERLDHLHHCPAAGDIEQSNSEIFPLSQTGRK